MAKRASGGARETDRRHKQALEMTLTDEAKTGEVVAAFFAALGPEPTDPSASPAWLARAHNGLARLALTNSAAPLSSRIQLANACYTAAGKQVDSAKLRVELDEFAKALDGKDAPDGPPINGGKTRADQEAARH